MIDEIEYNENSHRYRWKDSKQYIGDATIRAVVETNIKRQQSKIQSLTGDLLEKKMKIKDWEVEVAKIIKQTSLQHYGIGKPGTLNFKDYGKIGASLKFQYGKLREFSQKIINGQLSEKQIQARADLYLRKTNELYQEARRIYHQNTGWNWERRIKPARDSCSECIVYYNMQWQTIGTLPKPTTKCTCRANCKCYFEFSKSLTKPENQSRLFSGYGWLAS